MDTEEIFFRLINYASKAPSSHNTQPWKFSMEEDVILLYPDLSKSLPIVDPDNHALFVSLGCALENLFISAGYYGYEAFVETHREHIADPVRIRLSRTTDAPHADGSDLFAQIKARQVNRGPYTAETLGEDVIEKINELAVEPGTKLRLILTHEERGKLFPLVIEGSDRQFARKVFVNELVDWLRFSEREAMKKGDGIWNESMGFPATGRTAGSFIMKRLVSPRTESKRWEKLFRRSAGFVLFMVEKHEQEHWIRLGRTFQRFGLATTAMGLKHAHMNMPVEEEPVREKLAETFGLRGRTPLLLIRIGYADTAPYSFRSNMHEMLYR